MMRLARLYIGLVFMFLYAPLAVLVVYSFNQGRNPYGWQGFSLKWYESLVGNEDLLTAAMNSVVLAASSATLTTALGTLAALALHRYRFRGRMTFGGIIFTLMMVPDIVLAISLLIVFIALGMKLGFITLLLSHVTFSMPFVVITVYARLVSFNEHVIEAARDLGASETRMLRTILLPLILPALLAGWLLGFTLSLDDVVISTFMTGPGFDVLPLRIYSMVRLGLKPEVNALATLLLLLSLVTLLASHYFTRKQT
jgi:spermidine/putrescine transport system permease protein